MSDVHTRLSSNLPLPVLDCPQAFHKLKPDAEYDSWLTVGITGGDHKNAIAKIGARLEPGGVAYLNSIALIHPARVPACRDRIREVG